MRTNLALLCVVALCWGCEGVLESDNPELPVEAQLQEEGEAPVEPPESEGFLHVAHQSNHSVEEPNLVAPGSLRSFEDERQPEAFRAPEAVQSLDRVLIDDEFDPEKVTNTEQFPYSAVVRVFDPKWFFWIEGICSGTLIASNVVLTAAHCACEEHEDVSNCPKDENGNPKVNEDGNPIKCSWDCSDSQVWVDDLEIQPGYSDGESLVGTIGAKSVHISPTFLAECTGGKFCVLSGHDWALVELDSSVSSSVGWFRLYHASNAELKSSQLHTAGYPMGLDGEGKTMYHSVGYAKKDPIYDNTFFHYLDITVGSSGGGIWFEKAGLPMVLGVQSSEIDKKGEEKRNMATRLMPSWMEEIVAFVLSVDGEMWCPGYVGDNSCCRPDDPCNLAGDDLCNCDEACSWDADDCGPCSPTCSNKECGDDGCGKQCPSTCAPDEYCANGKCVGEPCIPNCNNKECGDNGCGEQCPNMCQANETCNQATHTCKPKVPVCNHKCDYAGQIKCTMDGEGWHKCYEDANKCRYWGSTIGCYPASCKNAKCGAPCWNPCPKEMAQKCIGNDQFQECLSFYGCLSWGSTQPCPSGEVCEAATGKCNCPAPAWWWGYLEELNDLDIVSDDYLNYDCSKNYNRAEWAKILGASLELEGTEAYDGCLNPFIDVPDGEWYTNYVAALSRLDYGDDVPVFDSTESKFNPGDKVDRCVAAKMVVEAFNAPMSDAGLKFSDKADIPSWCLPYVEAGVAAKILSNTTDPFRPADITTAGETASMVSKAIGKYGQTTPETSDFNHPSCGGQNECTDKCTTIGKKNCKSGKLAYCDDHDGDTCLEWGAAQECPSGTQCIGDKCVGICIPDCLGKKCGPDGCGDLCGPGCSGDEYCQAGTCKPKLVLTAGKIASPPNGSEVSNKKFTITWTVGYANTDAKTATGLLCKKQGGDWYLEYPYGDVTSETVHGLAPGSQFSCKVRTRLKSDPETWVESKTFVWSVSSEYSAMQVMDVKLEFDANAIACSDFDVVATIKNTGSQHGLWQTSAYLHPFGEGMDSPDAIKSMHTLNVDLEAGAEGVFDFHISHKIDLPVEAGQWQVTVVVEDVFNNVGLPGTKTVDAVGQDEAPPEILKFDVNAYEGTPKKVLPGKIHGINVVFHDDYKLSGWELSWRKVGDQDWQPLQIPEPESYHCLYQHGGWANWPVPKELDVGVTLEVRLRVWDALNKEVEATLQVVTLSSAEPEVTFISPQAGEVYIQDTNDNDECVPVEFMILEGNPIQQLQVGFSSMAKEIHETKDYISPIPADGHVVVCTKSAYAGDEIVVFVKVVDQNNKEFIFYSDPITVEFPNLGSPWKPIVVDETQGPAVKPGGWVQTNYTGLSVSDGKVRLYRTDAASWKDGSWKESWKITRLDLDVNSFDLLDAAVVLSEHTEAADQSGDSPHPARYDDWLHEFGAFKTNPGCSSPCDYQARIRDVANGQLSGWTTVGTYYGRKNNEMPRVTNFGNSALLSPTGASLLFVEDYKSGSHNRSDYFARQPGGAWQKVKTIEPKIRFNARAGNKLLGFSRDTSGGTVKVMAHEINESTGQLSGTEQIMKSSSDSLDWFVAQDVSAPSVYVAGWDKNAWKLLVAGYVNGTWVEYPAKDLPHSWHGEEVNAYYVQSLLASGGVLTLGYQLSTNKNLHYLGYIFKPGDEINLEQAFPFQIDSSEYEHRKATMTPDGQLLRIVPWCQWNMEERLCFHITHKEPQPCYDSDPCTDDVWDQVAGTCEHILAICEDDGDACNGVPACNPETGECEVDQDALQECDDGLYCNGQETCIPATGDCVDGIAPQVDDGLSCTVDQCNEDADQVVHTASDDLCITDACHAIWCFPSGEDAHPVTGCVETALPIVPDGLDCTVDACDPLNGDAIYTLIDEFCAIDGSCYDNGKPNPDNACELCNAVLATNKWSPVADGELCDDGLFCTVNEACLGGLCSGGIPVDCSELDDECNTGTCYEEAGKCLAVPVEDGVACTTDDMSCTKDVCEGGLCAHPPVADGEPCEDDGLPCTQDICAEGACSHPLVADGEPCEADGFDCTDDVCGMGECIHPVAVGCLVGDVCVAEAGKNPDNECELCDPVVAADEWSVVADGSQCDDGQFCTEGDLCQAGVCQSGEAVDCSTVADACNDGLCDDDVDACVTVPKDAGVPCGAEVSCLDGVLTLADQCDADGNCVQGKEESCEPYAACADDKSCADSCEDDDDCTDDLECLSGECGLNHPPKAFAGLDQSANEGAVVTLDGRKSSDPDGDELTYLWSQTEGPGIVLDDNTLDTPSFTAPTVMEETPLVFQLVVSDGVLDSEPDETTVTVKNTVNEPPVADAGDDVTVNEGNLAELDGSGSSDPNGDELTYLWSQVGGPPAVLTDSTAVAPVFTAPQVDADSEMTFKLVVNDGEANSESSKVSVTVVDTGNPPVDEGAGEDDIGVVIPDAAIPSDVSEAAKAPDASPDVVAQNDSGGDSGCSATSTTQQPATVLALMALLLAVLFLALKRQRRPGNKDSA